MHMQINGASDNHSAGSLSRLCAFGLITLFGTGSTACAAETADRVSLGAVAAMSPAAEVVGPFDSIRMGEKYVAEHAGTHCLVGSGNSMLPLYKDHTVVITHSIAMPDLKAGMTVAYIGESGRPVAHVLVKKSFGGWIAKGVGNAGCDSEPVTKYNLIGVVIKAYEPSGSPMVALLDEARARSSVASMP